MKRIEHSLVKAETFNISSIQFVNIYKTTIKLYNGVDREYIFMQIFYTFFKIARNIIVEFFWLIKINFNIDWYTSIWYYQIKRNKIIVDFFERFLDRADNISIFAFVYSSLDSEITSKIQRLSDVFYNYKNCFNFKNIEILLEHNNTNYSIDLLLEIESPYGLLYALFEKKLYIL